MPHIFAWLLALALIAIVAVIYWQLRQIRKKNLRSIGEQFARQFKTDLIAMQSEYRETMGIGVELDRTYRGGFLYFCLLDIVDIMISHPNPEILYMLKQDAEQSLFQFMAERRPSRTVFRVKTVF